MESQVLTKEELERKIDCKLLMKKEVCAEIGIERSKFTDFQVAGQLDGFCFKLDKDYECPGVRGQKPLRLYPETNLKKLREFFNQYDREMKALTTNKEITPDHFLARTLGFTLEEFLEEIKSGRWDQFIVAKAWAYRPKRTIYFLRKDTYLRSPVVSLTKLHEFINIHEQTVYSYVRRGLLTQPDYFKGTNKWDIDQARKDIEKIKVGNHQKFKTKTVDYFHLLSEDQQLTINRYISKRQKGSPIVWESKYYYNNAAGIRQKDEDRIRTYLSKYLIKIISAKRIKGEEIVAILPSQDEVIPRFGGHSEKIITKLKRKAEKFQLFDFNEEDIVLCMEGYKPSSEWTASEMLRPFLYYLLSEWEARFPGWQVHEDNAYRMEYFRTRETLFKACNSLIRKQPKIRKEDRRGKAFLTRTDIIKIYQAIRDMGRRRHPMKNWRRNVTMWMLGAFAAVRPEELNGLRIEHFDLDEKGLVKLVNTQGYGVLRIPSEVSKGMYSPSHEEYGTLIVPNLVRLINEYLEKEIYSYQKNRGKGLLFRAKSTIDQPDIPMSQPLNWLYRNKHFLDFMPEEKWDAFQFKSSRHTLNNMFDKTSLNQGLNGPKRRAGQIQMRHDIEKKAGSVGDNHYSDEISLLQYIRCVDEILNFPWNKEDLEVWEAAKGLVDADDKGNESNPYEMDAIVTSAPKTTEENDKQLAAKALETKMAEVEDEIEAKRRYEELNGDYQRLLKNPAKKLGMTFKERQRKINSMEKEMKILSAKIS